MPRGRPKVILSQFELIGVMEDVKAIPFLTKSIEAFIEVIDEVDFRLDKMNEQQLKKTKLGYRDIKKYFQRLVLLDEIRERKSAGLKLTDLEREILALDISHDDISRDQFFTLDRALESYSRSKKVIVAEKFRQDNEKRLVRVQKIQQQETAAQRKRKALSRLKYELGGTILSIRKDRDYRETSIDDVHALFKKLDEQETELITLRKIAESLNL